MVNNNGTSTKPQFEGDLTIVVFPLLKLMPKQPAELAAELGDYIQGSLVHMRRVARTFRIFSPFEWHAHIDLDRLDYLKRDSFYSCPIKVNNGF